MAEHKDKKEDEGMSINDAMQGLTRLEAFLKPIFDAKPVLLTAQNIESTTQQLKREHEEAKRATAKAIQERDDAQKQLSKSLEIRREANDNHRKKMQEEADALEAFKAYTRGQTDAFRDEHKQARQRIIDEIDNLESRRSDLARFVREAEAPELGVITETKGSARVEP